MPVAAATEPSEALSIGTSQAGNYLSALIAADDRDTGAADSIFARRCAPIRAISSCSNMLSPPRWRAATRKALFRSPTGSFARDPGNRLARLALAGRAHRRWPMARGARATRRRATPARRATSRRSLLTAWTYAGAGDLKHALDVADHIPDPSLRVFRDYHAGLISDVLGDPVEARRRLKLAYDADKNTLRLVDAYARFLSRHNDIDGAKQIYAEFAKMIPNHPVVIAAMADIDAGKPLTPLCATARMARPRRSTASAAPIDAARRRTRRADLFAARAADLGPITISPPSASPICSPT